MSRIYADDADDLRKAMRTNRLVLWLSRHWLMIMLALLFLYAGGSLTAPA